MPTLKYLDPVSGTYKTLAGQPGPPGPQGPPGDLAIVVEPTLTSRRMHAAATSILNATITKVPFDTPDTSNDVPWNAGLSAFIAPSDGYYDVEGQVGFAANATGVRVAYVFTGANIKGSFSAESTGAGAVKFATTVKALAGEEISVRVQQTSGASLALAGSVAYTTVSVTKVPQSYTGSAVSTYGERAYSTTRRSVVAQSFTTATTQVVTWDVVDDDNGISYNTSTGEFTIPVTGYYDISAAVHFATGATGNRVILIYVNGGVKAAVQTGASSTGGASPSISRTVLLNAGDLVKIFAGQGSGATVLLTTSSAYNWVTVTKVPAPVVNGAAVSGVWGTAPLDSFLYGSNSLIGREIYVDVNGQLRAKPDVVELGGGVDLNTITRTGNWTQSQTADAGTGTNYPVALAGLLEVVTNGSSMVWQRYTSYSSGLPSAYPYGNVYTRGYYNGTWYPWREVLPSDTGWVAIGIVAGFAAHPSDPAMVRKIGNVVHAKGAFAPTGMAVSTTFQPGIIPAGFEPVSTFYQAAGCSAGNITASFVIGAGTGFSGIQVRCGAILSTYYYLSGSWTID